MSLSGFAAGFAAGWSMVDDFMGDLEKRKEKEAEKAGKLAGEQGLADAQNNSVEAAGQRFAAARAGDGTTPETALPQDFGAPEEMPPYASTEGMPNTRGASGEPPSVEDMEQHIRASARARGIDPDVAVRVARSEGLARGVWQSNIVDPKRGREPSYGPLQLLVGGSNGWPRGVGNDMIDKTGVDPSDPKNWREAIDFGLDTAARDGWRQWYGAEKVGVGRWDGVRRGTTQPAVPASAVPGPRAAIDVPEDEFHGMQYGMQPTYFANAGGAIPDDQGRTTFSAQAPNAQGSVFLQHETQRPQQQARRVQVQPQQAQPQQPQQAVPTGPSTADRFREMRAGHAERFAQQKADKQAALEAQRAYEMRMRESELELERMRQANLAAEQARQQEQQPQYQGGDYGPNTWDAGIPGTAGGNYSNYSWGGGGGDYGSNTWEAPSSTMGWGSSGTFGDGWSNDGWV